MADRFHVPVNVFPVQLNPHLPVPGSLPGWAVVILSWVDPPINGISNNGLFILFERRKKIRQHSVDLTAVLIVTLEAGDPKPFVFAAGLPFDAATLIAKNQ